MELTFFKKIRSFICVLPQDLSPDYDNEVSNSELEEDHTAQFKSHQRHEELAPKNAPSEDLRQTESRGRNAAPLEPCGPRQGSFPRGHTGCGHCVNPGQSNNGMSPRTDLQSLRNPQVGSSASPAQGIHTALPFLEVRDSRSQDSVLPSLEETPAMGKGECRAPDEAERPVWEGQGHILPLPAQSYPPQCDLATDKHGEVEEEDEVVAKAFPLLEVATVGEDVDKAE